MEQIDEGTYQVTLHEIVTLEITPIEVNPDFIAASLDGTTLTSPVGPNPVFKFTVIKAPPLTHFVMFEASFPGAPPEARFDVEVSGSEGGNFMFSIAKADGVHDPVVRFRVT